MPTYEYACTSCGEHLEVVQAFSDDALTTCPNCGGQLRKVFGNIGIVLKGSGFYKTDSRPAQKSGGGTKDGGDSSTKESSGTKDTATVSEGGGSSTGNGNTAPTKDTSPKKPTETTKAATS